MSGSPPQARGRHRPALLPIGRNGLTPAGAGTARRSWTGRGIWGAHPRRRGDGSMPCSAMVWRRGSPPAGAGTARWPDRGSPRRRAHPRRRGDGYYIYSVSTTVSGSPPQARGRLGDLVVRRRSRAHPRRRGDGTTRRRAVCAKGLTPAGAGTAAIRLTRWEARSGLTPAGAGTALVLPGVACAMRAHPRRRGDGVLASIARKADRGSPPQARGRPRPDARP